MRKELELDLVRVLVKHNLWPDNYLRNLEINIEYKELREKGLTGKEAREQLAEKNCMSLKNIESILYGKSKNAFY